MSAGHKAIVRWLARLQLDHAEQERSQLLRGLYRDVIRKLYNFESSVKDFLITMNKITSPIHLKWIEKYVMKETADNDKDKSNSDYLLVSAE